MIGWFKKKTEDLFGRGGCWAKTRKEHLEREPQCAACGRSKDLEVHHIVPYHVDRSRECDPENLITLCADPCHLVHGHLMNFRLANETVREDCRRYRDKLTRRAAEPPAQASPA